MSGERPLGLLPAFCIWAALALAAAFYGTSFGYGGPRFAAMLGVFAFFLAAEIFVAAGSVRERIARVFTPRLALLLAPLPFLAYLIYALGTNTFLWWRAGIALGYALVPAALGASSGDAKPGVWQDYAALVLLFLPIKLHWLARLWPYPDGRLEYVLAMLFAITVGLVTFLFVRGLNGVGYSIACGPRWGLHVGLNFAIFAAIGIPLGEYIGFIRWGPSAAAFRSLPLSALGIFFLTAWPEEFLFRGLLQNLLSRTLASADAGWVLASVLFGFAHINHGVFPNWRYVLLATIAGLFYGRAWRKTGSIFASAIVHMLVDALWHLLFRTL